MRVPRLRQLLAYATRLGAGAVRSLRSQLVSLGAAAMKLRLSRLLTNHGRPPADRRSQPVLCFGDSITEGYHNIWPHPTFAPATRVLPRDVLQNEHAALLCHPYSIALGRMLSQDACDDAEGYKGSLRYARARGFSGWTAAELLPALRRSLNEGPWRCAVIMAVSTSAARHCDIFPLHPFRTCSIAHTRGQPRFWGDLGKRHCVARAHQ